MRIKSAHPATLLAEAKDRLQAANTCAYVLGKTLDEVLPEFELMEPESIWISLGKMGINLPAVNQAKIHAYIALKIMPSFYWDALVFEKTALAFSNEVPTPDHLEETTPEQLACAVIEANKISTSAHEFDTEPKRYAAVILHRSGFVLAPDQLDFAQDYLDRLNKNKELKMKVSSAWKSFKSSIETKIPDLKENEIDVQLYRLASVELHVNDHQKRLAD